MTASTWANVTATIVSTSTTTGALTVSGGVGIGGSLTVGGSITANTITAMEICQLFII